jgi:CheY-like chemotaxis protein
VRLYLPRASATAPEALDAQHDTAAASESHGLRVLLVEDNEEVAAGTEALLSMMNHDVTHIFNADGAIAMLEAARRDVANDGALPFDVVLSDIHMPGKLNGIDLAEILQSWTPRVPVILVTGYAEELDRARHVDARVLSKPFDIALLDSLLQAIREDLSARADNREHGEAPH